MIACGPYLEICEMIIRYGDLVNLKNLIVEGSRFHLLFQMSKAFDYNLVDTVHCPLSKGIFDRVDWSWVTCKLVVDIFHLFWEIVQVFEEFELEISK